MEKKVVEQHNIGIPEHAYVSYTAVTVPTFMHSTALRVCITIDHGHRTRTDSVLLLLVARDQLQRASRYDKGYSFCIRARSEQIGNVHTRHL